MSEVNAKRTRARTFAELQPFMFTYGAVISVFSPPASLYQLLKLNPTLNVPYGRAMYMSGVVFLPQTVLKAIQMNMSTVVKKEFNPWLAFGLIGVLQGGVYGQANIYFSKQLDLVKKANYLKLFRGAIFGGCRDVISQGIPFVCSKYVRQYVFDPIFPKTDTTSATTETILHWSSLITTSIASTFASQVFQNCQIMMQADPTLGYASCVREMWRRNGMASFYRGAEARVGLLLVANTLNELVLKPAWSEVDLED